MTLRELPADGRCPVCGNSDLIDFFQAQLPVHVGRLGKTRSMALNAPIGKINLCFCSCCGFVHNRTFDPSQLAFQPGYEVSLIHSGLFRAYLESVAGRLIDRYDIRHKTVVEVGCGMGEFLTLICRLGSNDGYGFDPTIPRDEDEAAGNGRVRLIQGFYGKEHSGLAPDLLCSLSVLECIQHPFEFLSGIREVIGDLSMSLSFGLAMT